MQTLLVEMMNLNGPLVQAIEKRISQTIESSIKITSIQQVGSPGGNSTLFRCNLEYKGDDAKSFIIKTSGGSLVSGEYIGSEKAQRFLNDWIGSEFLSSLRLEQPISPVFYGGDVQHGFFVLEDLGEHVSLVGPLLHGDAAGAEQGMLKYYNALGSLHAATAGKSGMFEKLFSRNFPGHHPYAEELIGIEQRIQTALELMAQLEVESNSKMTGEIESIVHAVTHPGAFHTYIHTDPCPDNIFDLGNRYLWIDFEWGHFGHALFDAVVPRMMWPSCWCANRLPDELISKLETHYRSLISDEIPAAREDAAWEHNLVCVCGMMMINRLAWDLENALTDDRTRGIITLRQRAQTNLEAFIKISGTYHRLPALRSAANQFLQKIQTLWVDTDPVPLYPAFQTS
jgi:hypothetical protein